MERLAQILSKVEALLLGETWQKALPRFSQKQCFDFAENMCESLHIDLERGIDGVPLNGMDDWLEERFGGVVGYIDELFLDIADGNSVSEYLLALSGQVNKVISAAATQSSISELRKYASTQSTGSVQSPEGVKLAFGSLLMKWFCLRN